jgi:RNA polymerase sigma factor (sigma-70 family)
MGDMASLGQPGIPDTDILAGPEPAATDVDFRDIYLVTYPPLVHTLWFVVHDHELAQEIAQDAFTELHRQWRKVRSYDRPDLWVRRVALRKAQREAARTARRRRVESTLHSVDTVPATEPRAIDVRAALRLLPPMQRAVVVLFYLEDCPMEEVADLLGCRPSTGFVHLHRARRRLAELLAETLPEEVDGDVR